ncbi:MAG: DNA-binding response regulator [Bacteroidetes bacterium]|nr:MAG: DNA-binding response regulator [Bacteroidota bacterium]RLD83735.1 MAG: DNA-binding response regulator [Bacteroidota bacterium]
MNILIIEDEQPAVEKLELLLNKYDPEIQIAGKITNVHDSINWLAENEDSIDLIFLDIQLTDGLSFDIFKNLEVKTPVIFTTAYDEYALEAFKVNSIDYLLKPIDYVELVSALKKFETFPRQLTTSNKEFDISTLAEIMKQAKKEYKNRFMVKMGEHIHSITTQEIACFYSEGRIVLLLSNEKRKFFVDFNMAELENMLDPKIFNRVNRSIIVNINAINDVIVYSKNRLKIILKQDFDKEIIVSREKIRSFKEWFSGG